MHPRTCARTHTHTHTHTRTHTENSTKKPATFQICTYAIHFFSRIPSHFKFNFIISHSKTNNEQFKKVIENINLFSMLFLYNHQPKLSLWCDHNSKSDNKQAANCPPQLYTYKLQAFTAASRLQALRLTNCKLSTTAVNRQAASCLPQLYMDCKLSTSAVNRQAASCPPQL